MLLYRLAGAWLPLDSEKAIRLYQIAFSEARKADPPWRGEIEAAILTDVLPLSPSTVLALLGAVDDPVKARLYSALINFNLLQGDYPAAVTAFQYAELHGVRPSHAAANLLASQPARRRR